MRLLTKQDLQPLFLARPDQRDYTLKRYFHPWQKIPYLARFKLVLKLMGTKHFDHFLDVGFGSGIFLPELAARSNHLDGIDIHPEIELVNDIIAKKNISAKLQKADLTSLPYPDSFFDGILVLSVLEFISDLDKAISEIKRVAKPGATIIIGAPITNPLTNFAYDHLVKFKNHTQAHQASHQQIISTIKNNFKIGKIIHYPIFLPLNYSLFFVLKATKTKSN